jgi:hypothetical protein
MKTTNVIRSIIRKRAHSKRQVLDCELADVPTYVAHIARCNVALRKLAVRAAKRAA